MRQAMFIAQLITDEWVGVRNSETVIDHPTWQQIEEAIRSLDGERKTLVTLRRDDDTHMSVGGGDGRFVAYATFDNTEFHNLIGTAAADEVVHVVAGGQLGDYRAKQVVDVSRVLKASRAFAETGVLEPSLAWEKQ